MKVRSLGPSGPAFTLAVVAALAVPLLLLTGCGASSSNPGGSSSPAGGSVGPQGGLVSLALPSGEALVEIPSGAFDRDVFVSLGTTSSSQAPPSGFDIVGPSYVLETDLLDDVFAMPISITLTYDNDRVRDPQNLVVAWYNSTRDRFEPVTVLAVNPNASTITFETAHASLFAILEFVLSLPPEFVVSRGGSSQFDPTQDGFDIANFGNYFSDGGNCLGMATWTAWYWDTKGPGMGAHYSDQTETVIASWTHLSASQFWGSMAFVGSRFAMPQTVATQVRLALYGFGVPVVLLMNDSSAATDDAGRHAVVVYGWNTSGFLIHDNNTPGSSETIDYNSTSGFEPYQTYDQFGWATVHTVARPDDLEGIWRPAEAQFAGIDSPDVLFTSHWDGQTVDSYEITLAGSVGGSLSESDGTILFVRDVMFNAAIAEGAFSRTLPIYSGANPIVALVGTRSGTSFWMHDAGVESITITGGNAPTALLVTLTWHADDTDVDLYVTDPGGTTVWFSSMTSPSGMYLDFDNTTGYGPEHVIVPKASAMAGEYEVRVHYYSDHETGDFCAGRVTVVVNEAELNQRYAVFLPAIPNSQPSNSTPGSEGEDWWEETVYVNVNDSSIRRVQR